MTNVRTRFFGPGKETPRWTKPTGEWRQNMVQLFQIELTGQPENAKIYIQGENLLKTYVEVQRTGAYSGMALWQRDGAEGQPMVPKAVSIMMAAIDPEADRKALAGLHRLRPCLNYPDSVYLALESEQRPIMATLFFDREAYEESLLVAACECFAEAFFAPPAAQAK